MLALIGKAVFDDDPWMQLLRYFGCRRTRDRTQCPCPCVWRVPPTGAVSDGWARETRWDWRDCRKERSIRLSLQTRSTQRSPAYGPGGFGR